MYLELRTHFVFNLPCLIFCFVTYRKETRLENLLWPQYDPVVISVSTAIQGKFVKTSLHKCGYGMNKATMNIGFSHFGKIKWISRKELRSVWFEHKYLGLAECAYWGTYHPRLCYIGSFITTCHKIVVSFLSWCSLLYCGSRRDNTIKCRNVAVCLSNLASHCRHELCPKLCHITTGMVGWTVGVVTV
jgi:hypothetical protein